MYKFSRMTIIVAGLLPIIVLCGCMQLGDSINEEEQTMTAEEVLLNLINNDESADNLIKTEYTEEALLSGDMRMSSIMEKIPIECVRLSNNKIYAVLKSTTGNYMFLLYDFSVDNIYPVDRWYCKNNITLSDFEKLAEKKASIGEVQEMDPFGSYDSLYMSSTTTVVTYHHTIDGHKIRVEYILEIGKPDVIGKIEIIDSTKNQIFSNLLPIDKALIG